VACMVRRLASCTGSLGALLDAPSSLSDSLQKGPSPTYLPTDLLACKWCLSYSDLPTYLPLLPSLALCKWCLSALVSVAHTLSSLSRHTWRTECRIWTSRACVSCSG